MPTSHKLTPVIAAKPNAMNKPSQMTLPEWAYGDGGPASITLPYVTYPWGSAAEAEAERTRLMAHLDKDSGQGSAREKATLIMRREVRYALLRCVAGRRCYSPACPLCQRALQKWFCWAAASALKRVVSHVSTTQADQAHQKFTCFSVISNTRLRGGLDMKHIRRCHRQNERALRKALEAANVWFVVGGVDVSFNRDKGNRFRDHFQLHAWLLAIYDQAHKAKPELKRACPKRPGVPKPVWVSSKPYDGNMAALSYALKPNLEQRISTPKSRGRRHSNPWNKIDHAPLTMAQKVTLAPLLHQLGQHGRLFLHGAELRPNKNGTPTIWPTHRELADDGDRR